jgi:Type I phosphodiesterase / nucleotide pyrophosphatase
MKRTLLAAFALVHLGLCAQPSVHTQNVVVITLDGFRWQELFTGADPEILSNSRFVKDTALLRLQFADPDPLKRRSMLMPFFWHVIARDGQLYGNRLWGNDFNVKNLYKVSYPGYNEIFTGNTDPFIVLNLPRVNNNINFLEFLNSKNAFQGKVVAFCSWNVFPFILNRDRNRLPINSGYEELTGQSQDSTFELINQVQQTVAHKTHCRHDWLTFLNAREYIEQQHPRVIYIGLGETDEFAHGQRYDLYLQQASAIDKMIADLWYFIQTNPFYKDKTTLIITTDHGRGNTPYNWTNHSLFTPGSAQTWLALLGPDIQPMGEIKSNQQLYAKQLAATITQLLAEPFETNHSVGKAFSFASAAPIPAAFKEMGSK